MAFLDIQNIEKTFVTGKNIETKALRGVTLGIDSGEFAVISGPSGSGKTTLLNIIGGLDQPTAGKVVLDGEELTGLKESQLARERLDHIGFVFQAYNLIPVLTARENIEYIMALQDVPRAERNRRTEEIAEHLGIGDLLEKKPTEMSGGQQQRVAVARAVVGKPKLVLADEPTANLDSANGEALMALMKKLNKEEGITVICTSHEQMVIDMARRHIVLKDGRVVQSA